MSLADSGQPAIHVLASRISENPPAPPGTPPEMFIFFLARFPLHTFFIFLNSNGAPSGRGRFAAQKSSLFFYKSFEVAGDNFLPFGRGDLR